MSASLNTCMSSSKCHRALFAQMLLLGLAFQPTLAADAPPRRGPTELQRLSDAAELKGLAEPFKGITANGEIEPGLFPIRSTGVSTSGVRRAAERWLAGLTPGQRDRTVFAAGDVEWRRWMNTSFYVRQGVSFKEMTARQRELAFGLLRASLSAKACS